MPGLSIHVVDVTRGVVARGMRVELRGPGQTPIVADVINPQGVLAHPALQARFTAGEYEAIFHVAAFYRGIATPLPAVPFLDVVHYHFGIADPEQHYHLPFKVTPWGYSLFRGGA